MPTITILNRFASVFAGFDLEGAGDHSEKHEGAFGLRYLLPLNIGSRLWVDTAGELKFAVDKHLELTSRIAIFRRLNMTPVKSGKSGQVPAI